jgi:hypothetical protein
MPSLAAQAAQADRWRSALHDGVSPCECGQLVLRFTRESPWDLSAFDAATVAELLGLDPADPKLGEGISRPHICLLPLFPTLEPKR